MAQSNEQGTDTNQATDDTQKAPTRTLSEQHAQHGTATSSIISDTNQASEDELDKILVDYASKYFQLLRTGAPRELEAKIRKEAKTATQSLIRTEKLKLLAEVGERVIGENDRGTITDPDSPSYGEQYESVMADKDDQRAELNKLEAEL